MFPGTPEQASGPGGARNLSSIFQDHLLHPKRLPSIDQRVPAEQSVEASAASSPCKKKCTRAQDVTTAKPYRETCSSHCCSRSLDCLMSGQKNRNRAWRTESRASHPGAWAPVCPTQNNNQNTAAAPGPAKRSLHRYCKRPHCEGSGEAMPDKTRLQKELKDIM